MRPVVALVVLIAAPVLAAPAGPHLKAGLWEQTQTVSGMPTNVPPMTSRFCTDDAVQARMSMLAANSGPGNECPPPRIAPQGDGFVVDVECRRAGGVVTKLHAFSHGDFAANYTTDATMTLSGLPAGMPAGAMPSKMVMHTAARYAGACPTGMRPGDVNMNGRTVNVLDNLTKPHP